MGDGTISTFSSMAEAAASGEAAAVSAFTSEYFGPILAAGAVGGFLGITIAGTVIVVENKEDNDPKITFNKKVEIATDFIYFCQDATITHCGTENQCKCECGTLDVQTFKFPLFAPTQVPFFEATNAEIINATCTFQLIDFQTGNNFEATLRILMGVKPDQGTVQSSGVYDLEGIEMDSNEQFKFNDPDKSCQIIDDGDDDDVCKVIDEESEKTSDNPLRSRQLVKKEAAVIPSRIKTVYRAKSEYPRQSRALMEVDDELYENLYEILKAMFDRFRKSKTENVFNIAGLDKTSINVDHIVEGQTYCNVLRNYLAPVFRIKPEFIASNELKKLMQFASDPTNLCKIPKVLNTLKRNLYMQNICPLPGQQPPTMLESEYKQIIEYLRVVSPQTEVFITGVKQRMEALLRRYMLNDRMNAADFVVMLTTALTAYIQNQLAD